MSAEPPHRRLRLVLDMGADDLSSLGHALIQLANDLEYEGQVTREVTSGGYDHGYHLTLTCDPEVTGDSFREALEAWRQAHQAAPSCPEGSPER